jgi:biopolymer transport protein ExbB
MNTPFGLANLWLEGDSITRFVALALLLCSIVTWVILLSRFWDLRNLRKLSPEQTSFGALLHLIKASTP